MSKQGADVSSTWVAPDALLEVLNFLKVFHVFGDIDAKKARTFSKVFFIGQLLNVRPCEFGIRGCVVSAVTSRRYERSLSWDRRKTWCLILLEMAMLEIFE